MELQIQDLVSSIRKDGIDAANAEAEAIITEAKKKADAIVAVEKILSVKVKDSLSDAALGKLIKAAIADEGVENYTAEVAQVSDALKAELAEEIKNGLEIKPAKGVRAGFRLAAKDGSGYFDCSDDEIMQMLMPYFRNLDF